MSEPGGRPYGTQIELGDLSRVRIRVVSVQYLSVLALLADAVGGVQTGLPPAVRRSVASAADVDGRRAALPIGMVGMVPRCVLPQRTAANIPIVESLDLLRSTAPQELTTDLDSVFGAALPPVWRAPMDRPVDWQSSYGGLATSVAGHTQGLWRRGVQLIDRETERVGLASVRGALPSLLGALTSKMAYADGRLQLTHSDSGSYDLGDRELVLAPMISGDRMLFTFIDDDRVWIGYPVPGHGQLWETDHPVRLDDDALAALLGPVRAAILRALRDPQPMGQLAGSVGCSAAQATFHSERLEAAGLVRRHRFGRIVRISRTELGAELMSLYGAH